MFSITPSTIAILGGTPGVPTAPPLQEREEPRPRLSFWGRLKQKAQHALGVLKSALTFTKEVIVPIIVAITPIVRVWYYHQQPCQGTERCSLCAA